MGVAPALNGVGRVGFVHDAAHLIDLAWYHFLEAVGHVQHGLAL